MNTKVEKMIKEMEGTNLLMSNKSTFVEYTQELIDFQNYITKFVMCSDYEEGMRLDEAIYRLEAKGRAKGISNDATFRRGINALKTVSKEIAIALAGKKGEDLVSRTLEYVNKPNVSIYKNIYVVNEDKETELDSVVLTKDGIIILEIKNIKDDVIITSEGRLVHSNDACYEKKPLSEKMGNKRQLLLENINNALSEKGIDFKVWIDSFVVFSSPKGIRVNVEDRLHVEKWCYRTGLNKKIDNYLGGVYYSDEQLAILNEILGEMESHVKKFEITVDYNEIRKSIAETLVLVQDEVAEVNLDNKAEKKVKDIIKNEDVEYRKIFDIENLTLILITITGMFSVGAVVASKFRKQKIN